MSVNQKILDAIELLTNHSIEKAGYDKTIQAQIVSCEDATIGKYKCRYQDMTFIAYAGTADVTYSKGAYVYILIPGNDMSRDKTILGTTQKLGINYISEAVGEEAYDVLGQNCVTTSGTYYLATKYKKYSYTIYKYSITSPLKIDSIALNKYIKKASSLIAGITIKNNIPLQEQYQGHYGITFNLVFNDNSNLVNGNAKQIIKSYTLDEDNMTGNPYRFQHNTRQYEIFEIDGENFVRIDSIVIFCQDFPNSLDQTPQHYPLKVNDPEVNIIFSSVEILGAIRKTEEENNGISISFYTPKGIFFKQVNNPSPTESLPITAQVRIKGKIVSDAQKLSFYWGKQNVGIFSNSQNYNQYLGRGWQCINEKNIISQGTTTQNPQIEWIPASDTYTITRSEATARENKIKVAVLYDGTVISKEIVIQNLQNNVANITIESDSGTQFYYDIGHPTLTCKVNGIEDTENYIYSWAWQNNNNNLEILESTTQQNEVYHTTYNALQTLKEDIANGVRFKNEAQQEQSEYENIIANFKYTQRIEQNKIYDLQINTIDGFAIFKCTVYDLNNNYIGTASITLSNSLQAENIYSLVIENGSVSYKYNQNGIAPNSKSLDDPQEILALTFKVYDNLGNDITEDIKKRYVTWKLPIENTLLVDELNKNTSTYTDEDGYRYYSNQDTLFYNIAQKHDVKKQNNQIELYVTYKEINLIAKTNFTFVKEGQPGTNGTQYIVKIVPYSTAEKQPIFPTFTAVGNSNSYIVNYAASESGTQQTAAFNIQKQFFKAQLWQSGQLVWEGLSAETIAEDGVTKPTSIVWSMLKNIYKANQYLDKSSFNVTNVNAGGISYINTQTAPLDPTFSNSLANILKCSITYNQHSYYGTLPITTAWVINDNYRIQLKDYTGFRYVTYSSDGMSPQYDNSKPFEFIVKEKINNKWEDISLVKGRYAINFNFSISGDTQSKQSSTWKKNNSKNLELLTQNHYTQNLQKNQCVCRPASRYDGQCVNNALICTVTQTINNQTTVIARIHIPIHFLLNKYGLAHINDWDGNSVQVDNEGGYILAPQMGAGKKNNQNQFTGVLMGEVKNPEKNKSDIGLLGYNEGDRIFFLNSENGSALFGKSNNGQIIIDPTSGTNGQALLYSAGFWENYDSNTGLPINYNSNNEKGEGLLINLTKPQIRYGNGKFKVDENGNLTAISGKIAGWDINGTKLIGTESSTLTGSSYEKITLDANRSRIYSGNKSEFTSSGDGFHLSPLGLVFGDSFRFRTKHLDNNNIMQPASLELGYLNGDHWTIKGDSVAKKSYISFGKAGNNNSVYIGTDKITLGTKFSVDNIGNLKAQDVDLTGTITATSGEIGGWIIGETSPGNSCIFTNNGEGIVLHSNGSIYSSNWSIDTDGSAYFGKIYGTIMNGQSLSGNGFTFGGGGIAASYLNPASVLMDGNAFGEDNSLGNGLYSAYKIKFDEIYATTAQINTLKTDRIQPLEGKLLSVQIGNTTYQTQWLPVVERVFIENEAQYPYLWVRYAYVLGTQNSDATEYNSYNPYVSWIGYV